MIIFEAAKNFSDKCFDGMKKGREKRVMKQAQKAGKEAEKLREERKLKQKKDSLERLSSKYPEAK